MRQLLSKELSAGKDSGGSFDEDDDGSETESEGEDVDEKEEGGHMDGSSTLYHDSVADMPMSATFPPPRHSSSSTSLAEGLVRFCPADLL